MGGTSFTSSARHKVTQSCAPDCQVFICCVDLAHKKGSGTDPRALGSRLLLLRAWKQIGGHLLGPCNPLFGLVREAESTSQWKTG